MAGARYCAVAAGDTPSTGRLYDAIACLCVPLIVVDDLELPFRKTRPFPDSGFGVRLPEAELFADPLAALTRIVQGGGWRAAQAALLPARRALSYRRSGSDLATLVLREAWAGCLWQPRSSARPLDEVARC